MRYVDGFVLAVPQKNLKLYRSIAQKAGKIWREYGAVQYVEAVGDDLDVKFGVPFPKMTNASPARRCYSRLSCSSHAPIAIVSMQRS